MRENKLIALALHLAGFGLILAGGIGAVSTQQWPAFLIVALVFALVYAATYWLSGKEH